MSWPFRTTRSASAPLLFDPVLSPRLLANMIIAVVLSSYRLSVFESQTLTVLSQLPVANVLSRARTQRCAHQQCGSRLV